MRPTYSSSISIKRPPSPPKGICFPLSTDCKGHLVVKFQPWSFCYRWSAQTLCALSNPHTFATLASSISFFMWTKRHLWLTIFAPTFTRNNALFFSVSEGKQEKSGRWMAYDSFLFKFWSSSILEQEFGLELPQSAPRLPNPQSCCHSCHYQWIFQYQTYHLIHFPPRRIDILSLLPVKWPHCSAPEVLYPFAIAAWL